MLTFVCATRSPRADFATATLLGRSLERVAQMSPLRVCLFADNTRALGECYNEAIADAASDDVLVFVHDDVTLDDWTCGWRVQEALLHFDVVGVAGNQRCQRRQQTWYLQPAPAGADEPVTRLAWDHGHLSGAIMHGQGMQARLSNYGPTPSPVALLDGVFLAVRAGRLKQTGVRFDPSLGFHFYDLDFCRQATAAGLKLGTWPIAITHNSSGESVHSQAWQTSRDTYFQKYTESL